MATKQEIHKIFRMAKESGEWFEYECRWQGLDCVRNTEMGYCSILTQEEAEGEASDKFYPIIRSDDTEFSEHYDYYYDEENDAYYAVRKSHMGDSD